MKEIKIKMVIRFEVPKEVTIDSLINEFDIHTQYFYQIEDLSVISRKRRKNDEILEK